MKRAFKIGLIEDDEVFLNMLLDRNKTSHIYSKQESQKIFEKIKSQYAAAIKEIVVKMKEM